VILLEDILKELTHSDDLSIILRVIHSHYLSKRDKEYYEIFILNLQGKPQRELGVLLGMQQFKVSKNLAKLRYKLQKLGNLLKHNVDDISEMMLYIKQHFTVRHYTIASYMFAGNKYYTLAKRFKCSPALIFYVMHFIEKKLPVQYQNLFTKCIEILT
jgi:hypothetical protein